MTLDNKRKVIEVLLCASWSLQPGVENCARFLGADATTSRRAQNAREQARDDDPDFEYGYSQTATEAAYRLIESSPTLRREWFGRP